jgi:ribosomal protein L18E
MIRRNETLTDCEMIELRILASSLRDIAMHAERVIRVRSAQELERSEYNRLEHSLTKALELIERNDILF